ncbi:MAG: acyl-CoA dehydrogenase family protein [Dehalococcoidia bacterium]|jgi:alkylation response protein AidB-like acyl-CoA dehydrogenase
MQLALSEEQEMLRTMARDFLTDKLPKATVKEMEESEAGYTPELWQEMAGLGWMGLALPDKYGGSDMSFLDLAVLIEEMGRACLPGPYFSSVVLSGFTILDVGSEEQKAAYLPKIASGEQIFTLALTEASASYEADGIETKAAAEGDSYVISGTKLFVPDANVADYMLVVAKTDKGFSIFIVDAKSDGISHTVLKTIAEDKLCEVVFDKVKVPKANLLGEADKGWEEVERIIQRAAVAKCCEMVGCIQQALDMTVEYTKDRKQYGKPIGSFQVIQHYCADMATDVESTRLSAYKAAWMLSEGLPCREEVAVAKAFAGEACQRVMALAHQIHGAIGVTIDHDLQYYTRRAKAAEVTFGDAKFFREVVAQEMGL